MTEIFTTTAFQDEFGTVRVENRPEGIVFWMGGRIRWKSWEDADFLCTRLSERKAARKDIADIMRKVTADGC